MTFVQSPGAAAWMLMWRWHDGRVAKLVPPDTSPGSTHHALVDAMNAQHDAAREAEEREAMREMEMAAARWDWMARRDEPAPDLGEYDDDDEGNCAHEWTFTGTAYGGDDDRWHGEGRCFCIHCGADGDA